MDHYQNNNPYFLSSVGRSFIKEKTNEYVEKNFSFIKSKISYLSQYFYLTDSILFDKVLTLLFPFTSVSDILFKSDLYIPIVSILTTMVAKSLNLLYISKLYPNYILTSFSNSISSIILLSLIYKGIIYFIGLEYSLIEMIYFVSIKYFYLAIKTLFSMFLHTYLRVILLIYFSIAFFMFLSKTIGFYVENCNSSEVLVDKKKYLFIVLCLEVLFFIGSSSE